MTPVSVYHRDAVVWAEARGSILSLN